MKMLRVQIDTFDMVSDDTGYAKEVNKVTLFRQMCPDELLDISNLILYINETIKSGVGRRKK